MGCFCFNIPLCHHAAQLLDSWIWAGSQTKHFCKMQNEVTALSDVEESWFDVSLAGSEGI